MRLRHTSFSVSFTKFLRTFFCRKSAKVCFGNKIWVDRLSFLKKIYERTTDFLNRSTENICIIRSRGPKKIWCLCLQTLVRINLVNEKEKNLLQFILEKTILCLYNSRARAATTKLFIKKWHTPIEFILNSNSKRRFCFFFSL